MTLYIPSELHALHSSFPGLYTSDESRDQGC